MDSLDVPLSEILGIAGVAGNGQGRRYGALKVNGKHPPARSTKGGRGDADAAHGEVMPLIGPPISGCNEA